MYKLLFLALCVASWQTSIAQLSHSFIGARANGTGNTTSCIQDVWSALNNPAGISTVNRLTIASTYDAMPSFPTFNRIGAVAVTPIRYGAFGAGVIRFGDDLYNEHNVSLGYANQLGLASLGLRAQYLQYHVEGFGRKSVFTFSAGGIARLTPWLSVGAQIINLIQPSLSDEQRLPTTLAAGVALKPSEKVTTMAEVEKDIETSPICKAGIEYAFHKKFTGRSGFNLGREAVYFGFGVTPRRFQFDYAFTFSLAGYSRQQFSLSYQLAERK